MVKCCADCGSTRVLEYKRVELHGRDWLVRNDGYRFYVKPGPDNALLDRDEYPVLGYKQDEDPASALAELFFSLLPEVPCGK